MKDQQGLLIKAIEDFNKKFKVQSPYEWIEKIENLEKLVDSVKVVKPINWLMAPDDIFEYRLYKGKTAIISPVQAWEQNHEKIAKYFPDFSKADLPIQVAFTRCFFFCMTWIGRDIECLFNDFDYTLYTNKERFQGVIPVFHYLDEAEERDESFNLRYFSRKIFKGRAKGSLAVGFLSGVQVLNDLLNNQKKEDFVFYWTEAGIIKSQRETNKDYSIDKSTLIKINNELYETYHNSPNPFNKKLINDTLKMADEWMPVCKFIHNEAYDRFWRYNRKEPLRSLVESYIDLKNELSLSDEEILRKYDERLALSMKKTKELKREEHCF